MKRKIIVGSLIAIVVIVFVSIYVSKNTGSGTTFSSGKVYRVQVDTIQKGDISASFSASGITEATDEVDVYFETPFRVNKILAKENEKVSKGQKILELDFSDLKSELEQLKITRDIQAMNVKKMKETQGLKGLDGMNTSVAIAKSNLESAQKSYDDGKKDLEEAKEAYLRLEISNSELDAAEKALSAANISLENAKLSYQAAVDSNDGKSIDIESQEKTLGSYELKISNMENKIKTLIESMNSPFDGIISSMAVKEGSYVSAAQPAFRIMNPGKLQIRAGIKEYDIKSVSVGQNVKITGDAIIKDASVTGKVVSLSPAAKKNVTSSGQETVVEAIISIEKSDVELKAGLNINCEIFTQDKKGVIVADFDMMKEDKDGNKFVFVVDKDNIMRQRQIKLGVNTDMKAEITSGLAEGDMVVVKPLPSHKDGAKVKATKVVKSEEE